MSNSKPQRTFDDEEILLIQTALLIASFRVNKAITSDKTLEDRKLLRQERDKYISLEERITGRV